MTIPFYRPSPSPPNTFKDVPLPEAAAHWLSKTFFHWITPILRVGYSRPLEAEGKPDLLVICAPADLGRSLVVDR